MTKSPVKTFEPSPAPQKKHEYGVDENEDTRNEYSRALVDEINNIQLSEERERLFDFLLYFGFPQVFCQLNVILRERVCDHGIYIHFDNDFENRVPEVCESHLYNCN